MTGLTDLNEILRHLRPTLHGGRFVYVLGPVAEGALASVVEPEGLSVVVEEQTARELELGYDGVFSWITLEVNSSLESVGLTAAVSTALARAGIACNVIAGRVHDHLLVPADRADEALGILQGMEG